FSSRRRHTRLVSDWSSDVCSSDLTADLAFEGESEAVGVAVADRKAADRELASVEELTLPQWHELQRNRRSSFAPQAREHPSDDRSEERRVGKESRARWQGDRWKGT